MGNFQSFKGDAEKKLFYIVESLNGGINTEFSDDSSPDNEFSSIINFDIDKRGSLYKRKGFGKLSTLTQILNLFPLLPTTKGVSSDNPYPETTNDNIVYTKILKNDNSVFRNLSAFDSPNEKNYRNYQMMYGAQNNTFKILIITYNQSTNKSTAWIFTCTLPDLEYDQVTGEPTATETIVTSQTVTELKLNFNWNRNLANIETMEYFNKIHLTSNNKGLLTFNRDTDAFTYSGFSLTEDNVQTVVNSAYKPNSMEIRKVGFNMLGDNPLYWVNYQGISTHSIQGVYLTTMSHIPILVMPYGGKFRINILYTGADNGFTLEFKEGDKTITHTSTVNDTYSKTGLKVYDIVMNEVPSSEVEIKITKLSATIDPYYDYYSVGDVDPEAKAVTQLNIGDYGICEMYNRAVFYKDDTIWFSEINNFNYVPNYNYVSLPIEPTDKITKIIFFKNVYIVFTKFRIYKLLNQFGTSSFQLMPVNIAIGCPAPNTIIPIENELYFASNRGLYALKSSEFRDGIENLKELDTKVKSLTSDTTLYLGELSDPAMRFQGIGERSQSFRYKDKYMLFYNTRLSDGELASTVSEDVLVYDYVLKAYTLMRFAIKPTFLFMVDNALTTFCTVKEKEDFTEESTLLSYDFESGTSDTITDLSDNHLDATVYNGYLQPGYGVELDGVDDSIKINSIGSDVDFVNGFTVEAEVECNNLAAGRTVFDISQLNATSAASNSSGSMYTEWSNGYRLQLIYNTTINLETKTSIVAYTARLHRDSTNRPAQQTLIFGLKQGTVVLIPNTELAFNFGSSTYVDVKTGTFSVAHDASGNYSKNWTLSLTSNYPTYSTGYNKGADITFDVTQDCNWSPYFALRLVGRTQVYDGGCRVFVTPFVIVKNLASLFVGQREFNTWINTLRNIHTIPAISSYGNTQHSGNELSVDISYTGSPVIGIDGNYGVDAVIDGVYRGTMEIPGFNITLPANNPYNITNWTSFTVTGTSLITLNQISSPSKRNIYMLFDSTNIKIGANSELLSSSFSINGVVDTVKAKWKVVFVRSTANYVVTVYKNDIAVGSGNLALDSIKNSNKDNSLIGKTNSTYSYFKGFIYNMSLKLTNNTKVFDYTFEDGRSAVVTDKSGNNRNGTISGAIWLVEHGLKFNGTDSYVKLPDLSSTHQFSNGFTIEFEADLKGYNQISKIIDLATGYDTGDSSTGKCSINIGVNAEKAILEYMTTSAGSKNYRLSASNIDLDGRHKWKCSIIDNGLGYNMYIYLDDVLITTSVFSYGGISNINRTSNYIGKSNNKNDSYFKGIIYNMLIKINSSSVPVPIYEGSMFEYDTTYDDFGKPMYIELLTKGINFKYPMHKKKLKKVLIKGAGGFLENKFNFNIYADGHSVTDTRKYQVYVGENGQIVYDYTLSEGFSFDETVALYGNARLDTTKYGQSSYQTREIIIPCKGKNFQILIYGESGDFIGLESFGFIFKLGKVRED